LSFSLRFSSFFLSNNFSLVGKPVKGRPPTKSSL
jgi:hypothetical protein